MYVKSINYGVARVLAHVCGCSRLSFGSQCGSWLAPSVLAAEIHQLAPSIVMQRAHSAPILTVKQIWAAESGFGLQKVLLATKGNLVMSTVGDLLRGC